MVLRKATRNVRKIQSSNMRTGQFLINFVNTAPLYNNMNTSSYSYWVTVHVFRTAGLSSVDLVTCLILSMNIAYKTKQNPVFKKNPLSVEATNTTGYALKSTDGVYRKVFLLNPRCIFEILRFLASALCIVKVIQCAGKRDDIKII